jgi:hypothetical protein
VASHTTLGYRPVKLTSHTTYANEMHFGHMDPSYVNPTNDWEYQGQLVAILNMKHELGQMGLYLERSAAGECIPDLLPLLTPSGVGHAIGLQHEHQRPDAFSGNWIQFNCANLAEYQTLIRDMPTIDKLMADTKVAGKNVVQKLQTV